MISKRFRRVFAGLLSGVMLVTAAGLPADAAVVDKEKAEALPRPARCAAP